MNFFDNLKNFDMKISGKYIVFGIFGAVLVTLLIYVLIYLYTLYYTWKNDSADLSSWKHDKLLNIKSNELEQLHKLQETAGTSMMAKTTASNKKK